MKSIRVRANRTGLLLSILLSAGVGWAQTASGPASEPASQPASVLKPGDRILFIGDSITGLGDRDITTQSRDTEFVPLIRQALAATHKDSKFELVTLGASGSTVGAWNDISRRAADPKQKEFFTDVPNNGVKATLAKNWDVVIIMLGMNDVLQPAVNDDKESLANWDASYARLIQTVRDRLHPRVVALAQCTMASEDPYSAMNRFIYKLNDHVAQIAKKADCLMLLTEHNYIFYLSIGRVTKSDFHVTYDYIHPNLYGQVAIAIGMLRGLGESDALIPIVEAHLTTLLTPQPNETTSTFWLLGSKSPSEEPQTKPSHGGISDNSAEEIVFHGYMSLRGGNLRSLLKSGFIPLRLRLKAPAGWSATQSLYPVAYSGKNGTDQVAYGNTVDISGRPDRLKNELVWDASWDKGNVQVNISIPTPWLITAGPIHLWPEHKFDEKAARTAIDDVIEAGKDFTGPIDVVMQSSSDGNPQPKTTGKLAWHRFFPSVDYTGGDAPGNVDFWSISYPHAFETGYAARWVWSDKDRPVRLLASSKGFTRQTYMQVWLNGKKEYGGEVSEEKDMRKEFPGALKKGWNCVAFRCCHRTYFFQSDLEMLGVDKDNLEDLRYSVVPKTDKSPAPQK